MSTLYRCKIRAAYKPFRSKQLIVFEENQIQEAEVDLKWENSAVQSNSDTLTSAPAFYSSLSKSTCRVTIHDPFLTGIAWPVMYDAASLYAYNITSATGIMLPNCGEGEDPIKNKCRKYPDIELTSPFSLAGGAVDDYPHLLVSMWYDVKGTRFGSDFYFRVVNMSINQGSGSAPSVQLIGEEARSILFNQNLVNYGFPEGTSFDDAIAKVVKDYGYTPSFCYADYSKYKLVQPTAVRDSGITPAESVKRRLNAVGGWLNSQPTVEWKDKISICTRNEVNQGCKVFYLGVGLFENYTIDGIPNTQWAANLEGGLAPGSDINKFSTYRKGIFEAKEYLFDENLFKNLRARKLARFKKNSDFSAQFKSIKDRYDPTQATTGQYFEVIGPAPHGKTRVKIKRENDIQTYAISPNGTNAYSYLDGLIQDIEEKEGRVLILTKYFIYACGTVKDSTTQQCFSSPIYQETRNLTKISVSKVSGIKNLVSMNQVIGTSTAEKKEFVRFFIKGPYSEVINIPIDIVAKYAIPEDGLSEQDIIKYIGDQPALNTPAPGSSTGLGPTANYGDVNPTVATNAPKILIMAGHADIRSTGTGIDGIGKEVDANIYALQWVRENASKYGITNILEFYSPPSSNITDTSDNGNSQYAKGLQATKAGKQVIELHHDAYDGSGRSGVIFSYLNGSKAQGKVYPLDTALSKIYGSFGRSWRTKNGGLGIPNRGGTMLEIAPFTEENARRALSSDKAIRDAYFKQALEPFMLSIAKQYSGSGNTTTPTVQPSTTSNDGMIPVGLVGVTGDTSGPHLHVQFDPKAPITAADVSKYIEVQGYPDLSKVPIRPYGESRSRGPHGGIDFSPAGILGKTVYIKNGAKVLEPIVGNCQNNDAGCNGRCGNSVDIETPEGRRMRMCHLAPGSVSPERLRGRIAGTGSASGSGKSDQGLSGGPTAQGLNISTSFKGIPRALRIVPGRTILSFITDYDNWIEQGKPRSIDPGVWLPERFSKYFITRCTYKWRGDLRVDLRGVIDWGLTRIETPTFKSYMNDLLKSGEVKTLEDGIGYYRYIRSLGDLCYKVAGKDSCETICAEVEAITSFLNANTRAETAAPSATTTYAQGPCRYSGSFLNAQQTAVANEIMNALYSAGVRTQEGFAGVLGNAYTESTLNPGIHLTSGKGAGCTQAYKNLPAGHPAYGLFQWCYERQEAISAKCGRITDPKSNNLGCQMAHTLQELRGPYASAIQALNSAGTPEDAAAAWNREFEKGNSSSRGANARQIFPGIKCDR